MYALFNSEDRAKLLSGREQAHAIELLEEAMQGEEKTGIISGGIFLNEAGEGKTTYFTWLAWRLSTYDQSLYVIKLIALEYSTDFERLKECGVDHWNDTQIVRLLYRFIHLALFVPSVCRRTIEETDVHRAEADRCAELISLSNGRIVLDETKTKDLTAMQLIELRLFREKFNQNQLVLILDGFDEIAPYYKDVVMKCFARFAQLDGLRNLYISSRPYGFVEAFKNAFSNCNISGAKEIEQLLARDVKAEHGLLGAYVMFPKSCWNELFTKQQLKKHATNLYQTDSEGRNLLHSIAQHGCFFMLHCLVQKGVDVSLVNAKNGWNVFHYIASRANNAHSLHFETDSPNIIFKYMLQAVPDPSDYLTARDIAGYSVLDVAIVKQNFSVARTIVNSQISHVVGGAEERLQALFDKVTRVLTEEHEMKSDAHRRASATRRELAGKLQVTNCKQMNININ
uniref:ANK_REP_REGION domain-containing protein n=1 Tax=Anopheles merus TaxID=30066 RepID=A0A182VFI9_ANOME